MSEKVGDLYYSISLDTGELIEGQRKVDRELKNTSNSLESLGAKFTATAAAAALLAQSYVAIKAAKLADEMRLLTARVEIMAGSLEAGAVAFNSLVEISSRTRSSLAGNIEVFTRLNQSILQMGGTQQDTLQLTELLAKAIKVSGASAVEAKSAMLQFGQALGSGKLAGDELRSLLENAPYLMRQLADGIGVPVGSLKTLGEQGKLTADVVTNALTKAASKIEKDFEKFPQTIEDAMVVARDSATVAALKFDELSGGSAALTGTVKGLGEVLEQLARQFGASNDNAGALGRNQAVSSWADSSRNALSYLIDAADVVWQTLSVLGRNVAFVFEGIGKEIGGIGAQVAAVLRGDFSGARAIGEAMVADSEARRKALDEADARTLSRAKTFGKQMREAWNQGAGAGRGSINPLGKPGKLKPPGGGGGGGGSNKPGAKFDSEGYLAGLEAKSVDAWERIGVIETEAKRKNDALLAEKKISAEQHERAVTLITAEAISERQKLREAGFQNELAEIKSRQAEEDRQAKAKQQAEDQRKSNLDVAKKDIAATNPIDAIRFEEEQKIAVLEAYRLLDLANTQTYEDAKAAIHAKAAADIKAVQDASMVAQLQGYGSLFGGIADITKTFAGEQDDTYKALFAASKAFAIADAIVKIQQGAADAYKQGFPAGLGAAATVLAQGAGIISTIRGTNYGGGRQYGGPVSSGSMYRVNETGAPEMFTANNGNQYMLPTRSGSVTAADSIGGGGINVNVSVDATGSTVEGNDAQAKQLGAMLGNVVMAKLIEQKRPGGILYQ